MISSTTADFPDATGPEMATTYFKTDLRHAKTAADMAFPGSTFANPQLISQPIEHPFGMANLKARNRHLWQCSIRPRKTLNLWRILSMLKMSALNPKLSG
jgi:hypothetical protein